MKGVAFSFYNDRRNCNCRLFAIMAGWKGTREHWVTAIVSLLLAALILFSPLRLLIFNTARNVAASAAS